MGKFDVNKISHVKGQDGQIESRDKAREMALEEDAFQRIAKTYETYLTSTADKKDKYPPSYKKFEESGMEPGYIRAVSNLTAESIGAMYDYEAEALEKSLDELRSDNERATVELLSYKKHPYISAEAIGAPDGHGNAQIKVEQVPVNISQQLLDTDMVEHQRIARLVNKLKVTSEQIQKRRQFQ